TVDAAQSCIETGAKTLFSQRHATRNGQTEATWIADTVGDERVHFIEAAARHLNADVVKIEAQHAILDHLDVIGFKEGERHLEVDARLRLHVDDFTKAKDDCLLALVHHENRGPEQE